MLYHVQSIAAGAKEYAAKIASTFQNTAQHSQPAYALDMGGAAELTDEGDEDEVGAAGEEWNGIVWAAVPKRRTTHRFVRFLSFLPLLPSSFLPPPLPTPPALGCLYFDGQ